MTLEELHSKLEASGWRFGAPQWQRTGSTWYAWKRIDGFADCECNDKPPCICLQPYVIEVPGNTYRSAEFEVCGETGGRWLKLTAYSVPIDEAIEAIPKCTAMLRAAWNAAVEVKE